MSALKRVLAWRGIRVRPYMLHLAKIVYVCLLMPVLFGIGFFVYFNIQSYLQLDWIMIVLTAVVLLFSLVLVHVFRLYLEERFLFFKKIQRLWLLARYLKEHNYFYEKKKKTSSGSVNAKIRFPKIYLNQHKFDLDVYFEMQGNKFQDKFLSMGGDLENTYFMDFMEQSYEEKFVIYKLAYSAFLNRIHARDVEYIEGKGIKLAKNFYWDFVNDPHLLVAGGTGGGKTTFLQELLVAILRMGTADICDPKKADFVLLSDLPVFENRVYFSHDEIVEALEKNVLIMQNRYQYMRDIARKEKRKVMGSFLNFDMNPHFVLCDEYNSLMASLPYQLRERADAAYTQLILMGRQSGVIMVAGMQKPSADDLPTKIRSNMMMHISLGRLDQGGYEMMFGEENRNKQFKYVKYLGGKRVFGRGYSAVFGEVAQEFYAPEIDNKFNFYDIFEGMERIANVFDPVENPDLAKAKAYSRKEIVDFLSEELPDLYVTEGMVRHLLDALLASDYKVSREDSKPVFRILDLEFMKQILVEKDSSDLSYKEIIEQLVNALHSSQAAS
ncbi:FtsK/SpoIIIE domain-containing protein [Streptococcus ferus]|uniref:FtsK/SpoIIIE domain-containing protein n=1 Tax=Streptococcus ferus TaxID=1345 RepID=UPI0035163952